MCVRLQVLVCVCVCFKCDPAHSSRTTHSESVPPQGALAHGGGGGGGRGGGQGGDGGEVEGAETCNSVGD